MVRLPFEKLSTEFINYPGDKMQEQFRAGDDGELVQDEPIPLFDMIQAAAQNDLAHLMARFGNSAAIAAAVQSEVNPGQYVDTTVLPNSALEWSNFNAKAAKLWASVSDSVKGRYNNDALSFANAVLSGDFVKDFPEFFVNSEKKEVNTDNAQ